MGARTAVEIGLADAFCPSSTALRAAFRAVQELAGRTPPALGRDWDALAAAQQSELAALLASRAAHDLLAGQAPETGQAGDLPAARRYAAGLALEAMKAGYELGFTRGLANDARLFGEAVASPSGQFWIERFLAKDPRQSDRLILLPPG